MCDMIGIRIVFPGKAIVYIGSADGSRVPVVREARPEDDLLVQGIRQDTEQSLDCLLYTSTGNTCGYRFGIRYNRIYQIVDIFRIITVSYTHLDVYKRQTYDEE